MHDGRFATLDEVVEHYNSGVKDGPALDKRVKGADGKPLTLNLADDDKGALVAFLKTLKDPVLARQSGVRQSVPPVGSRASLHQVFDHKVAVLLAVGDRRIVQHAHDVRAFLG